MNDVVMPNGTVLSDDPCLHDGCTKGVQHWHQHYADHSEWRFGQGCPEHLHKYAPRTTRPKE